MIQLPYTNHKILKSFSEYCQNINEHDKTSKKTKEAVNQCFTQSKYTRYISDVEKLSASFNQSYRVTQFVVSPKSYRVVMYDETLIIDKIGLLGNLGGLLGLFVGFSIFGYASIVLDAIVDGTRPDCCTNPSA